MELLVVVLAVVALGATAMLVAERRGRRRGGAVEGALAEAPEDAELEAACGLLAKRCAPPRDDRERARALALLLRRGYPSDLAYEAVRRHEQSAAAPRPL